MENNYQFQLQIVNNHNYENQVNLYVDEAFNSNRQNLQYPVDLEDTWCPQYFHSIRRVSERISEIFTNLHEKIMNLSTTDTIKKKNDLSFNRVKKNKNVRIRK